METNTNLEGEGQASMSGVPSDLDMESTASLLARHRRGDRRASDQLLARYRPILWRLAHRRLPPQARHGDDTDDLVQNTLMKAFKRLDSFEPQREGAFLGYLFQILRNEVRREVRRKHKKRIHEPLPEDLPAEQSSPLQKLVRHETLQAYEAALERLPETHRLAVFLRFELGLSHERVADAIGSPSANAARMLVKRALLQMARDMERSESRD